MCCAQLQLFRLFIQTDLHCILTPAAERASLRHIQKVDRCSADGDQTLFAVVHTRDGTEKSLRVLMTRIVENILRGSALTDAAAIHDHDLVAHICNNAQIMSYHNNRHSQTFLQILHQFKDLSLDRHIQRCRRAHPQSEYPARRPAP